ncbi:MAG: HNH endonuclease signature motif containing protein [Thermoguttaceae bacterium]
MNECVPDEVLLEWILLPTLTQIRKEQAERQATIVARREQRKAETIARNAQKRIDQGKQPPVSREVRRLLREQRLAEQTAERLQHHKERKERAAVALKAREKARLKTGWTREEVCAYKRATREVLSISKKHLLGRPKKYHSGNRSFDTEFERDEYVRGWREHKEWCEQNREAIKTAANARRSKRIHNMLAAGVFTLEAYDALLAERVHPQKKSDEHHREKRRIRDQWRNYRKQVKQGMAANGGRISTGWFDRQLAQQMGNCAICGKLMDSDIEIDHIFPVAHGGPNEEWNLRLTHPVCNIQKGDRITF